MAADWSVTPALSSVLTGVRGEFAPSARRSGPGLTLLRRVGSETAPEPRGRQTRAWVPAHEASSPLGFFLVLTETGAMEGGRLERGWVSAVQPPRRPCFGGAVVPAVARSPDHPPSPAPCPLEGVTLGSGLTSFLAAGVQCRLSQQKGPGPNSKSDPAGEATRELAPPLGDSRVTAPSGAAPPGQGDPAQSCCCEGRGQAAGARPRGAAPWAAE